MTNEQLAVLLEVVVSEVNKRVPSKERAWLTIATEIPYGTTLQAIADIETKEELLKFFRSEDNA